MLTILLASVFLNGVNVDGLRLQTFEKCRSVKIDGRGDVHLDCPGYQVEGAPAAAPAPAPPVAVPAIARPALAKHYWLVTEHTDGGPPPSELDIFSKSQTAPTLRSTND